MPSNIVNNTLPYTRRVVTSSTDSGGNAVNFDALPKTYTYNTDGTVNTITYTDGSSSWVQTFSYNTSGQLTGVSAKVKQ